MSKAAELAALIGSQTALSNRNLIINGAMQVAQRATSTTDFFYASVDRFQLSKNATDNLAITQSQDSDNPAGQGFGSSFKVNITTAESALAADENMNFHQRIEGQNLQRLEKGTSNAKSTTVSFWVKSNTTGTYVLELFDNDNNRHAAKTYTIDSANTWEKKTITFVGDTTGALDNDANRSMDVRWWLAAGSNFTSGTLPTGWASLTAANRAVGQVNLMASTNNWYITGIQWEVGEQATPFEHRSYGDELLKCYRYCYVWNAVQGFDVFTDMNVWTSSAILGQYVLPVQMNHDPAIHFRAVGDFVFSANNADKNITALALNRATPREVQVFATDSDHGFSSGVGGFLRDDGNSNATVTLEAEL